MRGVTETTRGSAHYPKYQSIIIRRNANEQDLEQALKCVGKPVKPQPQFADQAPPPVYRCAGARLDGLKRLILDLKKEGRGPKRKGGRSVQHAAII